MVKLRTSSSQTVLHNPGVPINCTMQNLNDSDTKSQDVEIIDLATLSLASPDTREYPREMSEHASVPWYQDPNASHPFSLSARTRVRFSTLSCVNQYIDVIFRLPMHQLHHSLA